MIWKHYVFKIIAVTYLLLFVVVQSEYVNAQQPPTIAKVIQDKYTTKDADGVPYVRVVYESSNTTLLQGGLIVSQFHTPDLLFNSDLWSAMDLLKKQYGSKLLQIMSSGVGSQGNPTVVYILMTK